LHVGPRYNVVDAGRRKRKLHGCSSVEVTATRQTRITSHRVTARTPCSIPAPIRARSESPADGRAAQRSSAATLTGLSPARQRPCSAHQTKKCALTSAFLSYLSKLNSRFRAPLELRS